jgi:magnesium chelatase subunit I
MESAVSNAERRSLLTSEQTIVPRIDIYAAIPSMTGKMELEYEGEQLGASRIARDQSSGLPAKSFEGYFVGIDFTRQCNG